MSDDRWLVVGLGNPESEYGGTRHNVGADAVRLLADRLFTHFSANRKVQAQVAEVRDGDARLVLAIPSGYMNESGGPVQLTASWYKIAPDRIVVVHDEVDLPLAALRLKLGGGTAGHNGLKDVARRLGTPDFHRVRIGVGRPPGRRPTRDHVLARFSDRERGEVDVALEEAADAVLAIVHDGLEPAQNRFHRSPEDPPRDP